MGIDTDKSKLKRWHMASSKEYLAFALEQLSELEEITYRAMMGEYILYYRGKIVGGIYDDRLLVKPVKSAVSLMPTASYELFYIFLHTQDTSNHNHSFLLFYVDAPISPLHISDIQ